MEINHLVINHLVIERLYPDSKRLRQVLNKKDFDMMCEIIFDEINLVLISIPRSVPTVIAVIAVIADDNDGLMECQRKVSFPTREDFFSLLRGALNPTTELKKITIYEGKRDPSKLDLDKLITLTFSNYM